MAMAKYDSLKDYMQLKHIDVISKGINDYIKSKNDEKLKINNLKILTQGEIVFMPSYVIIQSEIIFSDSDSLTFSLGISGEEYDSDNNNVGLYYYNIMLTGNMSKCFSDLHVIAVEECTQESLIRETVTSMFGLPDINVDNLEEESVKVYRNLYANTKKDEKYKYRFDPIAIKEKFKKSNNMHMYPADLPNGCLGQIRFEKSSATIYDIKDPYKPYHNYELFPNTILLNVKYYRNEIDYDDIITAAHELIHWHLHRDYIKLLQFLDNSYKVMECFEDPIIYDDKMSLKEKARWYAEWQAKELAIRVAIPKRLVEEAIDEYENSISEIHGVINSSLPHDGLYYKNMIYKLSLDFNVPGETMRQRFRQLGYDFADGVRYKLLNDNLLMPPFTFTHGTLKDNETFVIDNDNYERLLREDKEFAELIELKICVYTGYVVCINSPKYINYSIYNKQMEFSLSDYACGHADECCLIFTFCTTSDTNKQAPLIGNVYLSCDIIKAKNQRFNVEANMNVSEYRLRCIEKNKRDKELYDKMMAEGISTFSEALKYIMDKKEFTTEKTGNNDENINKKTSKISKMKKKDLAVFLDCDDKTIQNYRNGKVIPDSIEKVMLICLACETGPMVSHFMIEKSVGGIPDVGNKRVAYKFLLGYTDTTLDEWDRMLAEFGLEPIRFVQKYS